MSNISRIDESPETMRAFLLDYINTIIKANPVDPQVSREEWMARLESDLGNPVSRIFLRAAQTREELDAYVEACFKEKR